MATTDANTTEIIKVHVSSNQWFVSKKQSDKPSRFVLAESIPEDHIPFYSLLDYFRLVGTVDLAAAPIYNDNQDIYYPIPALFNPQQEYPTRPGKPSIEISETEFFDEATKMFYIKTRGAKDLIKLQKRLADPSNFHIIYDSMEDHFYYPRVGMITSEVPSFLLMTASDGILHFDPLSKMYYSIERDLFYDKNCGWWHQKESIWNSVGISIRTRLSKLFPSFNNTLHYNKQVNSYFHGCYKYQPNIIPNQPEFYYDPAQDLFFHPLVSSFNRFRTMEIALIPTQYDPKWGDYYSSTTPQISDLEEIICQEDEEVEEEEEECLEVVTEESIFTMDVSDLFEIKSPFRTNPHHPYSHNKGLYYNFDTNQYERNVSLPRYYYSSWFWYPEGEANGEFFGEEPQFYSDPENGLFYDTDLQIQYFKSRTNGAKVRTSGRVLYDPRIKVFFYPNKKFDQGEVPLIVVSKNVKYDLFRKVFTDGGDDYYAVEEQSYPKLEIKTFKECFQASPPPDLLPKEPDPEPEETVIQIIPPENNQIFRAKVSVQKASTKGERVDKTWGVNLQDFPQPEPTSLKIQHPIAYRIKTMKCRKPFSIVQKVHLYTIPQRFMDDTMLPFGFMLTATIAYSMFKRVKRKRKFLGFIRKRK